MFDHTLSVSRHRGRLLVVAGLAAATLGFLALGPLSAADADTVAIQKAVTGGLSAERRLPLAVAQAAGRGGDALKTAVDRANSELAAFYAGDVLAREMGFIQSATQQTAGPNDRITFSAPRFEPIRITGDTAAVTARVTGSATSSQVGPDGKRTSVDTPQQTFIYSLVLTRQSGRWLITGESGTFAPGDEP